MKTALIVVFGVLSLAACGKPQSIDECFASNGSNSAQPGLGLLEKAKRCGMSVDEVKAHLIKLAQFRSSMTVKELEYSQIQALPDDGHCRVAYKPSNGWQIYIGREALGKPHSDLDRVLQARQAYLIAGPCKLPEPPQVCDVVPDGCHVAHSLDGISKWGSTSLLADLDEAIKKRDEFVNKWKLCTPKPAFESLCWIGSSASVPGRTVIFKNGEEFDFKPYWHKLSAEQALDRWVQKSLCVKI